MTREEYLHLRRPYEPKQVRLAMIAESPPVGDKYFYKSEGAISEPLFSAIMKQLSYSAASKVDGLIELKRKGWILVDATNEQINELNDASRESIIKRDYPQLRDDLVKLLPERSTPLILIKANVCRILMPKLLKDGFRVLNDDPLPFPSTGHQTEFYHLFSQLLKSSGLAG